MLTRFVLRMRKFASGDFSAYSQLPDDFELVLAPEILDAGSYRGDAAPTLAEGVGGVL